jgi:tRNA-Thr(GGU) m(6)t(6)A37 methyltransferase TsaA
MKKIALNPIGFVKTDKSGEEIRKQHHISQIILNPGLAEALEGIQDFSHLLVIFWMDRISNDERRIMKVHPRGRKDMPLLGIFATRTPFRPNPFGITLVKLLNVEANRLVVQGLDAFNKTPILDIKPFDPWDAVQDSKVPSWWRDLDEARKELINRLESTN